MGWRAKRIVTRKQGYKFTRDDGVYVTLDRAPAFIAEGQQVWSPSFLTLWVFRDHNPVGWAYFLHDCVILHTVGLPNGTKHVKANSAVFAEAEAVLDRAKGAEIDHLLHTLGSVIEWPIAAAIATDPVS